MKCGHALAIQNLGIVLQNMVEKNKVWFCKRVIEGCVRKAPDSSIAKQLCCRTYLEGSNGCTCGSISEDKCALYPCGSIFDEKLITSIKTFYLLAIIQVFISRINNFCNIHLRTQVITTYLPLDS